MARLPVSRHNLQKAFQKHKACYEALKDTHNRSRRLILFYAVETGLKVYLLDKIQKHTSDDLFSHYDYKCLEKNGHDINIMLELAMLSGQFVLKTLRCKTGIQIAPSQYHQLWRYGLELADTADENEAETTLYNVVLHLSPIITEKKIMRSRAI